MGIKRGDISIRVSLDMSAWGYYIPPQGQDIRHMSIWGIGRGIQAYV